MANQPTKYRKFVVGAASAALVASAVAPVASAASFTDVADNNSHKASIDALVAKGVISGYPDGSFQPNKTLTRSDVVKMMGKWLKAEGYSVPTDYKTNPRFADLTSASNDELLQMAALVKDNGLFVGTPDGKLDPTGNITRENMAIVIVRAFDRVHNIDLATYVAGQEFKKDVVDLAQAKAEARPAIDVLDYFDITNPANPTFDPKGTTTRAQFASFLNKAIETDYSEVATGVVGDVAVKAVNATTVEVTFKDAVENVNSLNFTIEGLTVSNAAVKQSDNKTVVLTTAVQEGGKEYTVSLNNKEIGKFTGVSAVIPTKIDITTQSVQGKVGQQAIVSADVGVKQAGIPVTFNVKADTLVTLNKDQVFEALTNEDGIATFSYTQYAAGTDEVVAYPTGAPTVRSHAFVFWGVDTILSVKAQDEKGNSVNNGEDKTYKLTYLDPKTGKPVANKKFNVTFAENIDVNINQISKATVNGVNPSQLLNDAKPEVATVTTDAKGEAVFTVSGHNTAVTPIVFESTTDDTLEQVTYRASKLQATVDKVTFGALQASYVIDVTREGGEEAAIGIKNGREYKIVVKTKDGKVAANEIVNVAFNEDIDRVINTNTNAYFVQDDKRVDEQITVKTNSKGEAKFTIASEDKKDYATPIVWIDINSSNAKEGKFDEGEPHKVAPITYFAEEKLTGGTVKAYNDSKDPNKDIEEFDGNQTATFKFTAANQSGKKMNLDLNEYKGIDATFTVFNTGANNIVVVENGKEHIVSPNRSYTTGTISGIHEAKLDVRAEEDKSTSVRVVANGTAQPAANTNNRPINLGSHTAEIKITSTTDIADTYTGIVESVSTKGLTFVGKKEEKFESSTKFYGGNGAEIFTAQQFVNEILSLKGDVYVTFIRDTDGKKIFKIVRGSSSGDTTVIDGDLKAAREALEKSINAVNLDDYKTGNTVSTVLSTANAVLAQPNATIDELQNAKTVLEQGLEANKVFKKASKDYVLSNTGVTVSTTADTLEFTFTDAVTPIALDVPNSVVSTTAADYTATIANATAGNLVLTISGNRTSTPTIELDKGLGNEKFVFDAKVSSADYLTQTVTITVEYVNGSWKATAKKK